MDPHVNATPDLGLPPLPSLPATPTSPMPQVGLPTVVSDAPVAPVLAPQQADALAKAMPVPAEDNPSDELDQEWVNKAKAIVEKTKNDPFLESEELGKVKADYLKIRYNKHIKVTGQT